jgi:hypothetical protein
MAKEKRSKRRQAETSSMKKEAESNLIRLENLPIATFIAKILGLSPLLCDRFDIKTLEDYEAMISGANYKNKWKKYLKPNTPERELAIFEKCLYKVDDVVIGFPASGVKKAIISALMNKQKSKQTKIPGLDGKVVASYVTVEGVPGVHGDLIPLSFTEELSVSKVSCVNPTTKGRIIKERAQVNSWSTEFKISFYVGAISPQIMSNLISEAGLFSGLGSWRPNCNGSFGKFSLISFEEITEEISVAI